MGKSLIARAAKQLVPRKLIAWVQQAPYRRIERIRCKDLPGMNAKRAALYSKLMKSMGQDVYIMAGCIIRKPERISVGSRVSFQYNCFVSGWGEVTIGDDVSIGNGAEIVSSDHPYGVGIMREMPLTAKPVKK